MPIQYSDSVHLPAYLIKQLATPEAIAHESVRRKLKADVADATKAVLRFRSTPFPLDALTASGAATYEKFLAGERKAGTLLTAPLSLVPPLIRHSLPIEKTKIELERRYTLYTNYIASRAGDGARRDALIQAEHAARQVYNTHLATPIEGYRIPESDLE